MLRDYEEAIAGLVGLAGALFTFFLGDFNIWFVLLATVSFFDWLAGTAVGCKDGRGKGGWSEWTNAAGIAKKLGIVGVLIVCHLIDAATKEAGNPGALQFGGTLWYIAHEGLSLVKNLRRLEVPVFEGLGDALAGFERQGSKRSVADDGKPEGMA